MTVIPGQAHIQSKQSYNDAARPKELFLLPSFLSFFPVERIIDLPSSHRSTREEARRTSNGKNPRPLSLPPIGSRTKGVSTSRHRTEVTPRGSISRYSIRWDAIIHVENHRLEKAMWDISAENEQGSFLFFFLRVHLFRRGSSDWPLMVLNVCCCC